MAADVLDDDDGVVDDKTDGKHQRQKREQIDRIALAPNKDDQRADERKRNGDSRYQCRTD